MIVLGRDVVTKLVESDQTVVQHLQQYNSEEWTTPALVAWESYKAQDSRTGMQRTRTLLRSNFDRIIDFSDDTALEAAYLDEKLRSQGVTLPTVDLLHLAAAHAEGGTFVTHDRNDFDKPPLHDLVNVDIIHSA